MADIRDFIEALRDQAIGLRDATSAVGTGVLLAPFKGLYGLGKAAATGSIAEGANAIEDTHGVGETPKSEEGAKYLTDLGEGMKKGRELAAPVLDPYEEWATKHPALAAGGEAAAGLFPVGRVREAAVQGVKSAARAAAPLARNVGTATAIAAKDLGPIAGETYRPKTVASARVKGRKRDSVREDIEDAVDAVEAPAPEVIPPELQGFGTVKAAREKRLKELTQRQKERGLIGKQAGAGGSEKVAPDVFRSAWSDLREATDDPALATEAIQQAAREGEHLKPKPGGGYVGLPAWVQTPQNLAALRRDLDTTIERSAGALGYADPTRLGTWYDRQKAGHASFNEPWQLDRGLEGHAGYSAGAAPEIETGFAQRDWNARALGTGEIAYRKRVAQTLADAIREDRPAKLAFKVGEYRKKSDPRVRAEVPFGVNDFRYSQTMGYLDPRGNPWKAGASATMHPAMDAETALGVGRANEKALGNRTDWTGDTYQEVPWVEGKADDFYRRGKRGRYSAKEAGSEVQGMVNALRDANMTIADYLPKHTLTSTFEQVPGERTGHIPEIAQLPFDEQKAYGDAASWLSESPTRQDLPYWDSPYGRPPPSVGAGKRDELVRASLMRQREATEGGAGNWTPEGADEPVNQPLTSVRTIVDLANPKKRPGMTTSDINPPTMDAMQAIERHRGLTDAQAAVAANMPVTTASAKGKTSLLLERGTQPTAEELRNIQSLLHGLPFDVTPTDRGALLMNFAEGGSKAEQEAKRPLMKLVQELTQDAYPGSTLTHAGRKGFYLGDVTPPLEEAGKGIGTAKVLEAYAKAPEQLARNVSESEGVRRVHAAQVARDAAYPSARPDIQKTREFFRDADWAKVVEVMRKTGLPAAAAAATMGMSLEGMAAEPEPQR